MLLTLQIFQVLQNRKLLWPQILSGPLRKLVELQPAVLLIYWVDQYTWTNHGEDQKLSFFM